VSLEDLNRSEAYNTNETATQVDNTNETATQVDTLSYKVKGVYLLPQAGNTPNLKCCGIFILISLLIN
jgi:hypothetical protein